MSYKVGIIGYSTMSQVPTTSVQKKQFYCSLLDQQTKQPCAFSSSRKWNVDRHIQAQHAVNRKQYWCRQLDLQTGKPCRFSSGSGWNLHHHVQTQHAASIRGTVSSYRLNITPMPQTENEEGRLGLVEEEEGTGQSYSRFSSNQADESEATRGHTQAQYTHTTCRTICHDGFEAPLAPQPSDRALAGFNQNDILAQDACEGTAAGLSQETIIALTSQATERRDLDKTLPLRLTTPLQPSNSPMPPIYLPKTQPPCPQQARPLWKLELLASSLSKDSLPRYEVKGSKKKPGQQKAIEWLTEYAKAQFDSHLAEITGQWGVRGTHRGSCVLIPADWAALDPIQVYEQFDFETCPRKGAMSPNFSFSDHTTNLTRVVAWFGSWPRTGIELDNFLGAGPFKPMQGSHLCHHDLCIIHLVYESAEENNSRKPCHEMARFLRGEGSNIPPYCDKHQPPCLMQHAALTNFESFLIQFSVLRQARDLPAMLAPQRPRWHLYKTLEYQLPLQFLAMPSIVTASLSDLVHQRMKVTQKPDLCCKFCCKVKSFKSIIGLWSHLVHKHNSKGRRECFIEVPVLEELLLQEIRRTAHLWGEYWQDYSFGGKSSNPTMAKLQEVAQDGFTWESVLAWKLQ